MVVLMCGMPILVSKNFLETYGRFHKANRYTSQTLRQGFVAMQNLCSSIFVQVTRLLYTTNWATLVQCVILLFILTTMLLRFALFIRICLSWYSNMIKIVGVDVITFNVIYYDVKIVVMMFVRKC